MSRGGYVLDASALLAVLFEEKGAAKVEPVMSGASISAVNFGEVVAKLVDRGVADEDIVRDLAELDIEVVDVDRRQAELAGLLRRMTKEAGLSLGDRSCLALAREYEATAVTADRAWAKLKVGAKIMLVR